MDNNQSSLAINIVLIQDLSKKDPYLLLRMGLRPELHKRLYPNIPLIIPEKKPPQTKPEVFTYGEDPYVDIRPFHPFGVPCVF